jgi:GT2 family glycosyltransferase
LNASGIGVSSPQIGDIEPERKDWNLFVQKWGIPEDAQLPVVCTDIGNRQRFAPFELFSSLGVQDPGDSSAYSPAVSRPLPHEKPHGRPAKLTSIIIPCFNQIAYTKLCLQSIEKYTTVPYELILIDNGSTDGTQAFLEEYSRSRAGCNVILNKRNLGFAGGNNQGITAAKGDYILLLNNDVVVTEGWLERLITHIESDPSIGMIGPMSNSVSGPQLVKDARYGEDLNKMQIFAEEYSRKNLGKRQDILRLVGFCLLIKKEVIDIIGGLDENFISGNFEDDDLCLRSFVAGYRNVMAGDVFVHHYGSMTFKGNGIDYRATMQVNRQYFADKWRGIIEVRGNIYKIKMTKEQQLTKLIERGEEQFSQGHIESAVKIFKRVLLMDRSNFRALNNLGVIQWQIGHAVAAIETFQIALRFNPEDSDALANLLQAVTETGRFDLLNLNLLNTIKQIQPTNPDIDRLVSGHMETHGIPENHYAVENHAESAL